MGAAYRLKDQHNVVLFESADRLGGHARTVMAGRNGDLPVDTGFLVFNHVNYPHLTKLFDDLNVPTRPSDMGFGVSIEGRWLEYAVTELSMIFAQKRNILRPKFWMMLRDVLRFNKEAEEAAKDPSLTIGALLERMKLGPWFRDYYITPLTGAIWSTPTSDILNFPAHALIIFMKNHALMHHSGQHEWYTVDGGSIQYVRRLENSLRQSGVDIRVGTPVQSVKRMPLGVSITSKGQDAEFFDEVIFATHSDISLALLADPTSTEAKALGDVKYQPNDMILHGDTRMMPKRKAAWASWIYSEDSAQKSDRIDLTYWINNLQPHLPVDDHCFVTLNTNRSIDPNLIYDTHTFHHPVFDTAALAAQKTIAGINGNNRTWYCGAWMRNGFHEDGLATAFEAADALLAANTALVAAE
ncbi:MAG: NAD(P)/FAD-dependent oxidoreductase [Planktomarina sp.]